MTTRVDLLTFLTCHYDYKCCVVVKICTSGSIFSIISSKIPCGVQRPNQSKLMIVQKIVRFCS